MFTDSIAVGNC